MKCVNTVDVNRVLFPEKQESIFNGRWSWGGDYFGLTAAADGRFHVLWPHARSGKFELMPAAISVVFGK